MNLDTQVISLYLSKENKTRIKTNSIIVDTNGVIEDKFYAKDKYRNILITSLKSYEIAKNNGIDINYGQLGENILVNLDLSNIREEDIIQIGNIKLIITQNCTICKSLSSIDTKLPKLLSKDRGIFAKAISNGKICIGDKVIYHKTNKSNKRI